MNYKEEEGYQQKCCWPFSFFVCKSRIIHKDPFTHIIKQLNYYGNQVIQNIINIIYTMEYEIMDIIEDFTEFVKRINENNHREKLEHLRTSEGRNVISFSQFIGKGKNAIK